MSNAKSPVFRPLGFPAAPEAQAHVQPTRRHSQSVTRARLRDLYLAPVLVFLVSRTLLSILAVISARLLGSLHKNQSILPRSDPLGPAWGWFSPWFRFDAGWYVGLAQHGYHWGTLGRANTNFFPLFPLLIRFLQPFTLGSAWLSSLLISNLAFLLALILLWQWSLMHWEKEVALRILLLTTVFPFAFFFVTPYAESVFLLFAIGTFLLAEKERWGLASISAGLCAATRPVGAGVVLALLVMAIQHRNLRQSWCALAAFTPLLAFIVYLTVSFGRPLALLTYHSAGWVPPHGGLLTTVGSQFHTQLSPLDRVDATVAALFLISGILAWQKLGAAYGIYVLVGVLLPLVHGLVSMERYVILLFPVFAVWANWESKWGQFAVFAFSLMLMVVATIMFAVGFSLF